MTNDKHDIQERLLISGAWADHDCFDDYRSEWLGEILVERATLSECLVGSADLPMGEYIEWCQPGHDLVRFWLTEDDQVIDKVFDARCRVLGYYAPVTCPFVQHNGQVVARTLHLGLQMDAQRRVVVTGENAFESAIASNKLTSEDIEHAESRIRTMTASAAARLLPPAFVRNFTIVRNTPS